jgi:hypothetical protein
MTASSIYASIAWRRVAICWRTILMES